MIVRLFDIQNNTVIPTEHCYTLKALKDIMENYPEDHLKIYQYLFYMTCPSPDINPFFYTPEVDKESLILEQIDAEFSTEDDDVWAADNGISKALDNMARYMGNTPITDGRDGNINQIRAVAKDFDSIRQSFKGAYKDLQDEQQSSVRGGIGLGYDQ